MRNRGLQKAVLVLLCAVLLALPFLSLLLTASHAGHDCVGTLCAAWSAVVTARSFLHQLSLPLACAALALLAWLEACAYERRSAHRFQAETLITLKVRLNP